METKIKELYRYPRISEYEDVHLLDLYEQCAVLEDRVLSIAKALPEADGQLIESYILARNDLEVETFKTALRWGKQHYK